MIIGSTSIDRTASMPVDRDREDLGEPDKVGVRREDRQTASFGHGADQKVVVRSLQPASAAGIEMLRGAFEVFGLERFVTERPEVVS